MKTRTITGMAVLLSVVALSSIDAAKAASVTFFTNQSLFSAQLASSTTTDFEGIVGDSEWGTPEDGVSTRRASTVIDGVTYSASPGDLGVSGKDAPVSGAPYDSALLFSDDGFPLTVDLTTAGTGYNAIGGVFGGLASTATGTLKLFGTGGLLATENVTVGDLGFGTPSTFFGFIVTDGGVTSLIFDTSTGFEGIDQLTFGSSVTPVPLPASLLLLLGGLGSLGLAGAFRRRTT